MAKIIFSPEAVAIAEAVDVWKIELENARAQIKALSVAMHDLQHGIMSAIVKITAEISDSNDCAYNDGINTAIEILREETGECI